MANRTIGVSRQAAFAAAVGQEAEALATALAAWMAEAPRSLAEIEARAMSLSRAVGRTALQGAVALEEPKYAESVVPCECGGRAEYQRHRRARYLTLLGCIDVRRAYYLCRRCHRGTVPLDRKLGLCAGSISDGLDQVLALMGVYGAFDEAAKIIERLIGVAVCGNRVRASTEGLGAAIDARDQAEVDAAWDVHLPPPPAPPREMAPERLYISMDGTMTNIRGEGWKEVRLGAVYTTTTAPPTEPGQEPVVRATQATYYADLTDPDRFGQHLWLEAHRRGLTHAHEVIAIGDGAAWIWKTADTHFPGALQIVDWYHASGYLSSAANDAFGEGTDRARQWVETWKHRLWNGRVDRVIVALRPLARTSDKAREAMTYFANNRHRMRYPDYRARGIQIGSGPIEGACKHVVGQRLKQAGMRWTRPAAIQVLKARTALLSGRWDEVIALRPVPARSYRRVHDVAA